MYNILILDDEPFVVHSMKLGLKSSDYKIYTATNTDDAEKILRENKISVIISDHYMPGKKGLEFLKFARSISPNSIRIMITGQCEYNDVVNAINEAKVYKFLQKPFPISELKECINEALCCYKYTSALATVQEGKLSIKDAIHNFCTSNLCNNLVKKSVAELLPGMVLQEPLYSKNGLLLLNRHHEISGNDINVFNKLNIEEKILVKV